MTYKFGEIIRSADVRMLYDLKDVIYDKKWLEQQQNFEIYYMYRDLYKNESDYKLIKHHNLRYDITIIPPNFFGIEFVKTAGHYHPIIKNKLSYPEIYQVLEGRATYLLQKKDSFDDESVEDFMVIKAEKGDNVIIPPNYGHVTINESKTTLKMANWVCRDFVSEYDLIKDQEGREGFAYFLTTKGFIKNPEYRNVSKIRYSDPDNFLKYGFQKSVDFYDLVKRIDQLKFLTNPADFSDLFSLALK